MSLLRSGHWPSRLVRAFVVLLLLVVVLGVAGWFFGIPFAARYVEAKLKATVEQQMNARLEIGHIQYRFPYGVSIENAEFWGTTPGEEQIKLMAFDHLDLTLAQFPLRSGPLIIQSVDVRKPTFYMVETKAQGFIGLKHLLKDNGQRGREAAPKLSQVLRLRHVQLNDARVEYDDRTISNSVPFVWDKLGFTMAAVPHDYSAPYGYNITAGNGDTAKVQVSGTLDLDALVLKIDKLDLVTRLVAGQRFSPLPGGVQKVLNALHVSGGGHATLHGVVPLQTAAKDLDLDADFVIDDAEGKLSASAASTPLADLDCTGQVHMHGRQVTVTVDNFACRRGPVGVSVQPVTVNYTLKVDRWSVSPVRAAVAYYPPIEAAGAMRQRMTALLALTIEELDRKDRFRVRVADGDVDLPDTVGDVRLTGSLRHDDDGTHVERLQLDGLGGPVTLAGVVNDTGTAIAGELTATGTDLHSLYHLLDPEQSKYLTGKLDLHVRGAATESLDAVRGDGTFRLSGGTFARVPILGGIADRLKIGQNAFVAHEADGRFTLWPGKVTFSRIAVNTTVLAAVGRGDVGFDRQLDLEGYVDGHWREHPNPDAPYIPVLSEIGRALAGAGAYTFGSVSRQFTHVTVTGDFSHPKVSLSPAPVIGESLDKLFGTEDDD